MADFKYLGVTAYINDSEKADEKLTILSGAIEVLGSCIQNPHIENKNVCADIINSEAYQFLYDNDSVCYPQAFELPTTTPKEYQDAKIERVNIKGNNLIRLYIPTCAKNEDRLDHFVRKALVPTLTMLFDNDVISVKTRSAYEYEDFADAKEEVLIAADQKQTI